MASVGDTRLGSAAGQHAWWPQVVFVIAGLGAFAVYATLRAFEGAYFQ